MMKLLMSIFLVLFLASCTYSGEKNTAATSASIACKDPRPQICTREYNPVCASLKDGTTRTAATGCTACSDSQVVGYVMGECQK